MRTFFQPVPIGGWNASMAYELMQPTDAVTMINWIPKEESLRMRSGSQELLASPLGTSVDTMSTFRSNTGTEELICASDGNVYTVDIDAGTTTSVGSGYSNNRWQTVMFNNLLLMVNGEDEPQQYNGTTLANYTSALTGVTKEDVVGVCVFKGRCYYWTVDAKSFWYAGAGAYGGACTEFPIENTTQKGGYITECCTWTRDSGDGVDDLFVVLMSTGETLVYQGADGSSFSLIGKFTLGKPLSIRGSTNLASDRIILTKDGFVNLSTALQVGRASEKGNVSSRIINAAKDAAVKFGHLYGWEIFYHDKESLLMVNIPRYINSADESQNQYQQYCMNTNTGAWTRFNGWQSVTYAEVNDELYMGCSDGHIRKCFTGTNDDGVAITYTLIPAFTMCDIPTHKKQLTCVTLFTNYVSKHNIGVAGLSDFEQRAFGSAGIPNSAIGAQGEWGVSSWGEAYWSTVTSATIQEYNKYVRAKGFSVSCKINIQSEVQTANLYSIRYKYKLARSI